MKQNKVDYDFRPLHAICEDMTLRCLEQRVKEMIEKYGDGAVIHFDTGYNNVSEHISFVREETDKEMQWRLEEEERDRKAEEKAAAKREKQELKEYQRLHKKYGEKK